MDDYLAKPFTREELGRVLQRWLPEVADAPHLASGPSEAEPATGPLDPAALEAIRALDRDQGAEIVARVVDSFLGTLPRQLAALAAAVGRSDAAAIRSAAHALKSSSANVGAREIAALARVLEERGRAGSCAGAIDRLARITAAVERAQRALAGSKGGRA
jgi:HPt (histidine-containing phosphotransfer) domain-containing protein